MGKTAIEWATDVWNPVTGCTKVSQGCKHCYAERFAKRQGYDFSQVELHPERLEIPLHWKRPRRIFVNSMSDLFHEAVPDRFIFRVFDVMARAQQHIFMVLTKRPERMADFCQRLSLITPGELKHLKENGVTLAPDKPRTYQVMPLPNVWLGTSIEDQEQANRRTVWLLRTPAAVRFMSCEPLLGPIALDGGLNWDRKTYLCDDEIEWGHGSGLEGWNALTGEMRYYSEETGDPLITWLDNKIDWVIAGGESGPGARPMHPDWARSLRDQCQAAGVAFFFKQWGEWAPGSQIDMFQQDGKFCHFWEDGSWSVRIGKKRAGRLLDGREWNEYPEEPD